MSSYTRVLLALAALLMAVAVSLGAIGSHALRSALPHERLAIWHTAVEYHFYHALGLFAVGLISRHLPESKLIQWSGWLLAVGVLLFSGSLYAYALSGEKWLTSLTPAGGIALIAGWLLLAATLARPLN